MDILGLGTYAIDIIKKVDRLPGPDGFCLIEHSETQPGGSGTNVMVQAAKLGAKCGFICKVGDDAVGGQVLASMRGEGIDTGFVQIMKGGTSLYTEIVVDRQGDKFIMLGQGDALTALKPGEINPQAFEGASVFFTDLIPYAAARASLREAKLKGLTTVCNLQVGLETMNNLGISKEDILDALSDIDIFAPCRGGLFDLARTEDLTACNAYVRQYFNGLLLVTLGAQGSRAYAQDGTVTTADLFPVEVVDTTGAGDSYLGAFMAAYLLWKKPLQEAMAFASKCAAYTCTQIGARSSPNLAQARSFTGKGSGSR